MQMKQKWGKPQSTKFCEKEKARLARPCIMWAPKAKTKKKYEEEMFEAGITTQAFKMNRSHMILSLIII
jgi:hypothetical protein